MSQFKSFSPKVDIKRRLVLTRYYCGMKGQNSFMYQIHKVTMSETIHQQFKHLYALSNDEWDSVTQFYHSKTGEPVRVFKSAFKSVYGCNNKQDVVGIWRVAVINHLKGNGNEAL